MLCYSGISTVMSLADMQCMFNVSLAFFSAYRCCIALLTSWAVLSILLSSTSSIHRMFSFIHNRRQSSVGSSVCPLVIYEMTSFLKRLSAKKKPVKKPVAGGMFSIRLCLSQEVDLLLTRFSSLCMYIYVCVWYCG